MKDKPDELYQLKHGDILFSHINSIEHIGKTAYYSSNKTLYHRMNLICIRANNKITNSLFLYYLMNCARFKQDVKKRAQQAVNQASISTSTITGLFIVLPPLPEQRAIASALSDVDALIEALDRLIDKKRKIKQGTMQQLLSGKKRLKGFGKGKGYKHTELVEIPEDWEVKTLGEVCTINPESTGLPNTFYYIDLESVVSGKILNKKLIERDNAPSRAQRLFRQYDVLYQLVRPYQLNNLYIKFDSDKYVASTGYAIIRSNCGLFVYYVVNTYSFMTSVLEKCTGTSYPAITSTELASIPIPLPPLPEQRAIASVLSDMDAEIEALEAKRNKYTRIKQGMMQDLLTGRVRLKI